MKTIKFFVVVLDDIGKFSLILIVVHPGYTASKLIIFEPSKAVFKSLNMMYDLA